MNKLPSPGTLIAPVALFIALSGSATAALLITGRNVKNGSLTGADVRNGSLSVKDVKASERRKLKGPKGDSGPKGDTGPSTGPAGGVLKGSYPAPQLADNAVGPGNIAVLPAASVGRPTSLSVVDSFETAVPWTTESFDTSSMWSDAQPTRLTAPRTGIYRVSATVAFDPNGTGVRELQIIRNGVSASILCFDRRAVSAAGERSYAAVSCLLTLAQGDYIEALVRQTSGGSLNVAGTSTTRFDIDWVTDSQ
jgi:hypothetical protein